MTSESGIALSRHDDSTVQRANWERDIHVIHSLSCSLQLPL